MDRDVKCISEFGGPKDIVGLPGNSRYRARVCGMTKYLMSCLWRHRRKYYVETRVSRPGKDGSFLFINRLFRETVCTYPGDARYSAGVQERTFTAESGQENFLKNS